MSKQATLQYTRSMVASFNGDNCANCGKCQDYCPTGAISEKQKAVCHLCPQCSEMKAMTPDEIIAMQETACTLECPMGISPQGFINLLKAGKEEEAYQSIFDKNPLPGVCGYVCHHPCEEACKRGKLIDRPMEIRAIQRYLSEKFIDSDPVPYRVTRQEKIAVIGAGPAGLSAAHTLAGRGYKVVVFEQNSEPGGMLVRGIPDFRLDKETVRREIRRLERGGIEIRCNEKVADPAALLKDYDRVVLAIGTQLSKSLPLAGYPAENVFGAMDLMSKVNAGQKTTVRGHVVVIGGGSVACDTARTALRLGAEKVTMICLESGGMIPAHRWELEEAFEEGVELIEGVTPLRFEGASSKMTRTVVYQKIENLDLKTFRFDRVEGSEASIEADTVIFAVGQKPDKRFEHVEGIVYAGDAAGGKCSVIDALTSGRNAALSIDTELRGAAFEDCSGERRVEPGDLRYKVYPATRAKLEFKPVETLSAAERVKMLDVVEKTLTDDAARLETWRCLKCGYRDNDAEKCIGCGVCMKVCPMGNVITMEPVSGEREE